MTQTVAADLEVRIGKQLRRTLFVGLHPFAAGEERGLHPLSAEEIDDAAVIARNAAVGLAKIKGQRDQLLARGKLDASDRAAQILRHRRDIGKGLLLQRW